MGLGKVRLIFSPNVESDRVALENRKFLVPLPSRQRGRGALGKADFEAARGGVAVWDSEMKVLFSEPEVMRDSVALGKSRFLFPSLMSGVTGGHSEMQVSYVAKSSVTEWHSEK